MLEATFQFRAIDQTLRPTCKLDVCLRRLHLAFPSKIILTLLQLSRKTDINKHKLIFFSLEGVVL
jgi:hypothetical protein